MTTLEQIRFNFNESINYLELYIKELSQQREEIQTEIKRLKQIPLMQERVQEGELLRESMNISNEIAISRSYIKDIKIKLKKL